MVVHESLRSHSRMRLRAGILDRESHVLKDKCAHATALFFQMDPFYPPLPRNSILSTF